MLLDSGADLVITSSPLSSLIEVTEDISLICLDSDWDTFQDDHSGNLSMVIPPESAMYILYTSGSTGMPKGVVVEHGKFTAHVWRMQQLYALAPGERVLQFSELSFDAGLEQLFCGLTAGLTVVMRGEKIPSAIEFQQLIESNRVNVVDIPPAYWRFWTESQVGRAPTENSSLRCVIVGGDVMDIGGLRAWQQTPYRKIRLINTYGPTEGVVGATSFDVTDELLEETIPIGKPLAGNKIYLLDAWMQPVPVGIQGEIYIGGEVLGRGYWKNPGLTAENFLPDPFDSVPGSRMYKTGDVALWYQDGNLEFMGRKDWQVKIRGYRIELGEIEFAVKSHPDVNEACVIRQELIKSEPRLVAYLTPTGDHRPDGTLLRKHLQQVLPDYMIPSVYKWLDVFPHTSSGKIDRRALPILDDQTGEKRYIPPHTAVEKVVIGVFQEVLNVDHIGLQDNFFELGGHSLLAIKVAAKIESLLGILIAVRLFFQTKAIAELISSLIDLSSNPGLLERRAALVQKLALMSEAEVDALLNSSELHNPG
jgi:amino acid adenylation domain-containing protein